MGAINRTHAVMGEVVTVWECVCVCVRVRVHVFLHKEQPNPGAGSGMLEWNEGLKWLPLNHQRLLSDVVFTSGTIWTRTNYIHFQFLQTVLLSLLSLLSMGNNLRSNWQHNAPKTLSTTPHLFKINHLPQIALSCFSHLPRVQLFVFLSCNYSTPHNTTDRSEHKTGRRSQESCVSTLTELLEQ